MSRFIIWRSRPSPRPTSLLGLSKMRTPKSENPSKHAARHYRTGTPTAASAIDLFFVVHSCQRYEIRVGTDPGISASRDARVHVLTWPLGDRHSVTPPPRRAPGLTYQPTHRINPAGRFAVTPSRSRPKHCCLVRASTCARGCRALQTAVGVPACFFPGPAIPLSPPAPTTF